MNLNELFSLSLFSIGIKEFTLGMILGVLIVWIIIVASYYFIIRRLLKVYFHSEEVEESTQQKIKTLLRICLLLLGLILTLASIQLDYQIYTNPRITIRLSSLLSVILAFQTARLIDWLVSKVLLTNYYEIRGKDMAYRQNRYARKNTRTADRTVQYIVYVAAILVTIQLFQINFNVGDLFGGTDIPQIEDPSGLTDSSSQTDGSGNNSSGDSTSVEEESQNPIIRNFRLHSVFVALLIILAARLGAWVLINLVLYSYYKRQRINIGSQYAINQLLKYFIYTIALLIALESMGVRLTVLWGGAAALLVGVGLGLQQTFNDLISGIILLFERTVEVGDFVQIEDLLGTVKRIGLRTSLIESRENITVIVPNSKLIVDNVINWSHYDKKARFSIKVGVAYGSNTQMVKDVLLKVAKENGHILKHPSPIVRFKDFGNSSLDFELLFWSNDFLRIEDIQSEMRFEIDHHFREEGIEIPFPQRDIWIRTPKNTKGESSTPELPPSE